MVARHKYLAVPIADARQVARVLSRALRQIEAVSIVERDAVEVALVGYVGRKPAGASGWPTVNHADALALVAADAPTSANDPITDARQIARRLRLITEARRESD